ncbi:MAG TPA: radical SAM protein [Elusimicrobiales bacterium]|nr:radical SAM protein [Elusimicrobiales bacterium]
MGNLIHKSSVIQKQKPKLTGHLCIEEKDDKFLVYIKEYPVWAVVNWVGVMLLRLSNGKNTIGSIINTVSALNNKTRTENEKDILNLFQYLADICMIELADGAPYNKYSPRIYQPFVIYLNITNNCNLKCSYCYANAGTDRKNELTTEQIYTTLDSAAKISKNVKINVSGGEPLLRADLWDIATKCRKLGFSPTLLTNGTLVTRENALKIKKHFDDVLISIDGGSAVNHDKLRGHGSFAKALRGLNFLLDSGVKLRVGATITNLNIDSIPKLLKIPGITPSMLTLNLLIGAGRGHDKKNLRPSNEEIFELFKKLEGNDGNVAGFLQLQPSKLKKGGHCRMGQNIISVDSNGDVFPCHTLHKDELLAGNVKEEPLHSIFAKSSILKKCRDLTVDKIEKCKDCELKMFCAGGCRADAYVTEGNFTACSTYCDFLHSAIKTYMWKGAPRWPIVAENNNSLVKK